MQIGVAYATDDEQVWLKIEVPDDSTVEQAIQRSGLMDRIPSIDLDNQKVGIFGKITKLNANLQDGDRIEIYRPITVSLDDDDDDDDDL